MLGDRSNSFPWARGAGLGYGSVSGDVSLDDLVRRLVWIERSTFG